MVRFLALALTGVACLTAAGCGSAGSVKPGIPDGSNKAPANPTPDMDPNAKATKA